MGNNDKIQKIIISSIVFVILFVALVCIMTLDLPINAISSVKSIFEQKKSLVQKEANLVLAKNNYDNSVSNVETVKKNYESQKKKYESISDETIKVIKDAYTTQDYTIEYMWIKLGNYAQKNRLSIILVEPGGTATNEEANNNENNTVTSTDTSGSVNSPSASESSSNLRIKITGSYLDISNFIFELESDSELKFRLDNISMELVSGTTISATFEVKNVVISK